MIFFLEQCRDDCNHVRIAGKMVSLEKAETISLPLYAAQMGEVDALAKLMGHLDQIIVRAYTEGADAESEPIAGMGNGPEQPP